MELFGVEITGEHVKLVTALLGGVAAGAGFLAGRWSRHVSARRFKREDLVTSSLVIELYAVTVGPDGGPLLQIVTQGRSSTLEAFFPNAELVRHVRREAARHSGLMQLSKAVAHRMMMDAGKDALTGLDAKANMDFLHGRPTRSDETLFAFAAFGEQDHDGKGLHDQIARLVLMVVSPCVIDLLADADFIAELRVRHSGYRPRCDRLHVFAKEWRRLEALPAQDRSAATDKIWQVTVRTSM